MAAKVSRNSDIEGKGLGMKDPPQIAGDLSISFTSLSKLSAEREEEASSITR